MNNLTPPAHLRVTLTVTTLAGLTIAETWYQPIEGGWRCHSDGPLRWDTRGHAITHQTLDSAATAMSMPTSDHQSMPTSDHQTKETTQ